MGRPSKRSSSAAAPAASKKAKKSEGAVLAHIAAALSFAHNVPEEVTRLLSNALEHSLSQFKEDRHPFEHEVLAMVAQTLTSSEQALKDALATAEAAVAGGDDTRARREAAVGAAGQNLLACQEAHKQKQEAAKQKLEALKATVEPVKSAHAQQKEGDKGSLALEAAKADLDKAVGELLAPLAAAGGKQRQRQALSKALSSAVEPSLLEAMLLPLAKKPASRGHFDEVILENLGAQVAAKQAALGAQLQQAAPAKEERAAAVKAAQEAHEGAKAASELAAEELKAAKEAEAAAKSAAAAAKQAAGNLTAELLAAAQKLDKAKAQLEHFRAGALASFNELRERSAPLPEAPPPAAEAVAAEAEPPATRS